MSKQRFKLMLLNDILLTYPETKIEGDSLIINCRNRLMDFSIEELFTECNITKDYNCILEKTLRNIESFGSYTRVDLALEDIFPLVKQKGSVDVDNYNLEEFPLFLDLSYFLVQDTDDILRFVSKDKIDNEITHQKAISNLSAIDVNLELVDKYHSIYAFYGIDYAASLLLIPDKMQEVEKVLTDEFIFAAPNSDSLVFAKNTAVNIKNLSKVIKHDPLPRLSNNVYTYTAGYISYADPKKRMQLI